MISEYVQQWSTIETVAAACFSPIDVWVAYLGIGGSHDKFDVTGYLTGVMDLPTLDRDLVAHAVNEMILDGDLFVEGALYSTGFVAERSGFAHTLREACFLPEPDQPGHPAHPDADDANHTGDTGDTGDTGYAGDIGDTGGEACAPRGGEGRGNDEVERRRNQALAETGLLDAGAEERFDRITAETCEQFGVSWAFIVLIAEDCHVIKSVAGPDEQDLPWVYDLCARTIEADRTFVVADAAMSPEFKDDAPLVRFFAGHPICTAEGWPIGTLCLIDDVPRSFSAADERELSIRAAQVEIEIWAGCPGG